MPTPHYKSSLFAPKIASEYAKGRSILVVGLGTNGLCTARSLLAGGATVFGWDDNPKQITIASQFDIIPWIDEKKAWQELKALVLSPGVPVIWPAPHPLVAKAWEYGTPIICDLDLLYWAAPHANYIGISGSNGKSTTTSLTYHILQNAGLNVAVGGNLGLPALALPQLDQTGYYVLEVSSYQLQLMSALTFDYAALLNIVPDHLKYHWGMDGYIAAKKRLFRTVPDKEHKFIINLDNQICRTIYNDLQKLSLQELSGVQVNGFSLKKEANASFYFDEKDFYDNLLSSVTAEKIGDWQSLSDLQGAHNQENGAAAYAIARRVGVSSAAAWQAMTSFKGLPHRQEIIKKIPKSVIVNNNKYNRNLLIINDSKATNVEATCIALAQYNNIYWIAGGLPKGEDWSPILKYINKIKLALFIGEAAQEMEMFFKEKIPIIQCGNLENATAIAWQKWCEQAGCEQGISHQDNDENDVLLLSPACASWDQFTDFTARGDKFKELTLLLH